VNKSFCENKGKKNRENAQKRDLFFEGGPVRLGGEKKLWRSPGSGREKKTLVKRSEMLEGKEMKPAWTVVQINPGAGKIFLERTRKKGRGGQLAEASKA